MKKAISFFIIATFFLLSCSKTSTDCKQETLNKLLGKWVDENNRLDTLVFNANDPGPCDSAGCFSSTLLVSTTCDAIGGTNQRSLYFCKVNQTCDSLLTKNFLLSSIIYTPKSFRFLSNTKVQLQNIIGNCSSSTTVYTYVKF